MTDRRIGVILWLLAAGALGASLSWYSTVRSRPTRTVLPAPSPEHLGRLLSDAIRHKSLESVQRCLDRGADPNGRASDGGATSLMLAAHVGDVKIASLLLDRRADPNAIGQIVIPEGFDTHQLDLDHRVTPLIEATWTLNASMVRLLLARGADPFAKDSKGLTALNWAQNLVPTTDPATSASRMRKLDPILTLLEAAQQSRTVPGSQGKRPDPVKESNAY